MGALARLAASRANRRTGAVLEATGSLLDAQGEQSQALNSSAIRRVSYDMSKMTLDVTFVRGRTYTYYGVPASVYINLVTAPSAGRYFVFNIRNNYRYS